ALVLVLFVLVVLINAPLHRWAPAQALSTGELAVIVCMTLVSCALPAWGLMRFLVPTPVVPFKVGIAEPKQFWEPFLALKLPDWLSPVPQNDDGRFSEIVRWFYTGRPPGEPVPYRAWIVPLATWGVFIAAMMATLVAMARLVLEQWMSNERLPFPL